jgi:pyruvate,water dikinase
MAVVVQQMLDPVKSGVLFTVDPVHRRRDRMVVEAVFGLGEQLVSGAVTPDHYIIDRAGECKRNRVTRRPVLDTEDLRRLADLGRRLEMHFGAPQDIEWAVADGTLYLLQSRPVTTL